MWDLSLNLLSRRAARPRGADPNEAMASLTPRRRLQSLRALADAARANRVWWLDAHYRRELCARPDADHADWLQYGHALKELGHFRDAESAYLHSLELQPDDAEVMLQMGHLTKLSGRFADARRWLERADAARHPDTDQIKRELRLIAAVSRPEGRREFAREADGLIVYLSAAVPLFEEGETAGLAGLGGRDYSYAFAMRNFIAALEAHSLDFEVIQRPEYIPDAGTLGDGRRAVHIGFYPPEQIRLLKGAYNVICFAWEFERLRTPAEEASYHAFADQATMLRLPDELWVPSSETAQMIRSAVGGNVRHVPAPLKVEEQQKERSGVKTWREIDRQTGVLKRVEWQPLAILPRLQGAMNQMARTRQSSLRAILARDTKPAPPSIFLTVMNVHDFRKQLRPMVEGFLRFSAENPDAVLLIKMTTPDRGKLTINEFIAMDQISDPARLIPPMVSDRIWITDNFLTAAEMKALYNLAAFYLCTSYAEGQNLPLLEAMSYGVVPVSVDVTAMADYIDEENAVVIRSTPHPADVRMTARYRLLDITLAKVEPEDVVDALARATTLQPEDYVARSAAARRTVSRRFASDRVASELERIESELTGAADRSAR